MTRNIAFATLAAALLTGTASADTLREALVSTYNTNPTITAQREVLRGTDASVAIARAAGRPTVAANVGINRDLTRSGAVTPRPNPPAAPENDDGEPPARPGRSW